MAFEGTDTQPGSADAGTTQDGTTTTTADTAKSSSSQATPGPAQKPGVDEAAHRGVLADLQKERKARQEFEQKSRSLEAQFAEAQRRVQALAGVQPKSDDETQYDAVRAQFAKLFPGLAKLNDAAIDKILQTADKAEQFESFTQQHWVDKGRQALSTIVDKVTEDAGITLSDRQEKLLKRAFVAKVEEDTEFAARYENGDKAIYDEFAKEFIEDWLESARRKNIAAQVGQARPTPNGGKRSVPAGATKKINYSDPKALEDALVESFRSGGNKFDNE